MNKFYIYQLNDSPEYRDIRYQVYSDVVDSGHTLNISDYDEKYFGRISGIEYSRDEDILEVLFNEFNMNVPRDFSGHSLSVSDVIVLHFDVPVLGRTDWAYYVDSVGFKELPEQFLERTVPVEEIETIQSLTQRRDDLLDKISLIENSEDLRYSRFAPGRVKIMTEDIKQISERLDVLLDAQEEKYNRQSLSADMSFRSPALALLDKYGYRIIHDEQDEEHPFIEIMSIDNPTPFATGTDGWELMYDQFSDIDRLASKFTLDELQEVSDKYLYDPDNGSGNNGYIFDINLEDLLDKNIYGYGDGQVNPNYPVDMSGKLTSISRFECNVALDYHKKQLELSYEQRVYLTGLPVSHEMKDILKRLKSGENVPSAEINATSEMKTAATCINHQIPTTMISGREDIRNHIFDQMVNRGSFSTVDNMYNIAYNGGIDKGNRLDIVIGLPGSGKSSAIVNRISEECKSLIIDNDDIKKLIPEYNEGWGGDIVHAESKMIERNVFLNSLHDGKNVVLPKVGSSYDDLMDNYIIPAKAMGYNVNIHYVELSKELAVSRQIERFIETGKYQPPELMDKYCNERDGNLVEKVYKEFKESCLQDNLISGCSYWDNNVERGEQPILVESHGLDDDFISDAVTYKDRIDGMIKSPWDGREKGADYGSNSKQSDKDAGVFHEDVSGGEEFIRRDGDNRARGGSGAQSQSVNQSPDRGAHVSTGQGSEYGNGQDHVRGTGAAPERKGSLLDRLSESCAEAERQNESRHNMDPSVYREKLEPIL